MSQWYYLLGDQTTGPVTLEDLHSMASQGQLNPDTDYVWEEGSPDWVPLATVMPGAPKVVPLPSNPAPQTGWQPPTPVQPSFPQPVQPIQPAYQGPTQPQRRGPGAGVVRPGVRQPAGGYPQGQMAARAPAGYWQGAGHGPVHAQGHGQGHAGYGYPIPTIQKTNFILWLSLLLLGMLMVFGGLFWTVTSTVDIKTEQVAEEKFSGTKTTVSTNPIPIVLMALGYGCLLWHVVLYYIYLYRAWAILLPGNPSPTPGTAVGLLFVPLFNVVWIFFALGKWPAEYNRITYGAPNLRGAPQIGAGFGYLACGLSFVGIGAFMLIYQFYVMCCAVNFMHDRKAGLA